MRMKFQFIGLMLLAIPASAGEYAVLSNGFRIHADRHESESGTVTLYEGEGVTKLPAASIARFETEENAPTPAPPVPAAPAIPAPAAAVPITPEQLAKAAAEKYHLPESFVRSVMKVESNLHQEALSPKGAIGLMQLMPDTARTLGVNPKNSKENAEGGAQYLRDLLARYENRPDQVLLALAAYNAGPGAVEKYHGVPPYNETRRYILRVLRYWDQTQKAK